MALENLGSRIVNIESNWISFDSIALRDAKAYYLLFNIEPSEVIDYSYFKFRMFTQLDNLQLLSIPLPGIFHTGDDLQSTLVKIARQVDRRYQTRFQVRRFPIIKDARLLPEIKVTAYIDEDEKITF